MSKADLEVGDLFLRHTSLGCGSVLHPHMSQPCCLCFLAARFFFTAHGTQRDSSIGRFQAHAAGLAGKVRKWRQDPHQRESFDLLTTMVFFEPCFLNYITVTLWRIRGKGKECDLADTWAACRAARSCCRLRLSWATVAASCCCSWAFSETRRWTACSNLGKSRARCACAYAGPCSTSRRVGDCVSAIWFWHTFGASTNNGGDLAVDEVAAEDMYERTAFSERVV